MIKFFRHIRLRLLTQASPDKVRQRMIKENLTSAQASTGKRFSKYLLYAIGEIILVVIGILIALQINNWNEERKLKAQRQLLISSMLEDFQHNRDFILNNRLPRINNMLQDADVFLALIQEDTAVVSVDSLRQLANTFFIGASFHPNLTSLKEATSSGRLNLLENKALLIAFNKFEESNRIFQKIADQGTYNAFNGASWELRRTVPPNYLAGLKSMPEISYGEYKKVMDTPLAQSALDNSKRLIGTKKRMLLEMLEISKEVISMLEEMQKS